MRINQADRRSGPVLARPGRPRPFVPRAADNDKWSTGEDGDAVVGATGAGCWRIPTGHCRCCVFVIVIVMFCWGIGKSETHEPRLLLAVVVGSLVAE
jgi:hypothetical protein